MNKALQGDAAIVADSLEDNCSWQDLLKALKAKFAVITLKDVMMKTFYQSTFSKNRDHLNIVTIPFHCGEKHTNSTG